MPPRKKKVVEEEPLIVETDPSDQVIDQVIDQAIDTEELEEVHDVVETVKEEVTKTIDVTLNSLDDVVEEATKVAETAKEEAIKEVTKVVETVKEEVTKIISIPLSGSFLDFIKKSNDPRIILSKESIDILNKIFSLTPNFLDDIEKSLLEVVKDGKIDSNDIPHLILLIQKLYETIYRIKDVKLDSKTRTVICSEALKIISYFLITERRIKIEEEKITLVLEQINTLVDSCVGLLSFSSTIKVKGCFDLLFGKK
jgi:hypothetical protein